MGKRKATEKDVRFALEYGKERLIRTIVNGGKFEYTVSPSNLNVPEPIFQKLQRDGFLEVYDHGLFDSPQSFVAKTPPTNVG